MVSCFPFSPCQQKRLPRVHFLETKKGPAPSQLAPRRTRRLGLWKEPRLRLLPFKSGLLQGVSYPTNGGGGGGGGQRCVVFLRVPCLGGSNDKVKPMSLGRSPLTDPSVLSFLHFLAEPSLGPTSSPGLVFVEAQKNQPSWGPAFEDESSAQAPREVPIGGPLLMGTACLVAGNWPRLQC